MRKLIPVILLCFIVGLSGCNKTEDKKVPVTNNTSVERNSNDEIEIQNENESANTEEKKQNSKKGQICPETKKKLPISRKMQPQSRMRECRSALSWIS